jgi:hypothetical protein
MNTETLRLWGKGTITLPKEWREQFPTKNFLAVVTPEGLLIKPILQIEYYEHGPDNFGLRFPFGIEAGKLLELLETADDRLRRKTRKRIAKRRSHK